MSKHTPGPWQNDCGLVYGREPKNMSSPSFDIFDASEWPGDVDEAQANARLIAAAPELLEALELAESIVAAMLGGGRELVQIRAAIAKARGEG